VVVFILHSVDSIAAVRSERFSILQADSRDRQKGEGHQEATGERCQQTKSFTQGQERVDEVFIFLYQSP
jgi:hypothetical protein